MNFWKELALEVFLIIFLVPWQLFPGEGKIECGISVWIGGNFWQEYTFMAQP